MRRCFAHKVYPHMYIVCKPCSKSVVINEKTKKLFRGAMLCIVEEHLNEWYKTKNRLDKDRTNLICLQNQFDFNTQFLYKFPWIEPPPLSIKEKQKIKFIKQNKNKTKVVFPSPRKNTCVFAKCCTKLIMQTWF